MSQPSKSTAPADKADSKANKVSKEDRSVGTAQPASNESKDQTSSQTSKKERDVGTPQPASKEAKADDKGPAEQPSGSDAEPNANANADASAESDAPKTPTATGSNKRVKIEPAVLPSETSVADVSTEDPEELHAGARNIAQSIVQRLEEMVNRIRNATELGEDQFHEVLRRAQTLVNILDKEKEHRR